MNEIIMKLVRKEKIEDKDISNALYEICDSVHSSCSSECPVFEKNGSVPWNKDLTNCIFYKNGNKMLKFLRLLNK